MTSSEKFQIPCPFRSFYYGDFDNYDLLVFIQGLMMGIIVSSTSLARILGSIYIARAYEYYGPRWSLLIVVFALLMVSAFVTMLFNRLVPFYDYNRRLIEAGRLEHHRSEIDHLRGTKNRVGSLDLG